MTLWGRLHPIWRDTNILPLNAFERVPLLNTVLIPRWTYRTLFLPNDSMFKAMDAMCLPFVVLGEGMELNKICIHKSYNVRHVNSPHCLGGMGVAPTVHGPQGTLHHNGVEHVTCGQGHYSHEGRHGGQKLDAGAPGVLPAPGCAAERHQTAPPPSGPCGCAGAG